MIKHTNGVLMRRQLANLLMRVSIWLGCLAISIDGEGVEDSMNPWSEDA